MPQFSIKKKEGIKNLLDTIGLELKVPGRKAIGIIVDADDDLDARWQAVTYRLRKENIEVPEQSRPNRHNYTQHPSRRLMVHARQHIARRTRKFCLRNDSRRRSDMAASPSPTLTTFPELDRKFTEKKILRAKVHAWLATREDPRSMGIAICAGDLHIDGTLSTTFANWLRQLFE